VGLFEVIICLVLNLSENSLVVEPESDGKEPFPSFSCLACFSSPE
jgi:hypothetical protein